MRAVVGQFDVISAYGMGVVPLWDGLMAGRTAVGETRRFADRPFGSRMAAMVPDLDVRPDETRARAILRRLLLPLVAKVDPETSLLLATTVGEIEQVERSVDTNCPAVAALAEPTHLLAFVQQLLGLHGPAAVLSSACASSSAALGMAASAVRSGRARRVLVVTCDAVSELVYSGFSALAGMSERPAKPFDGSRNGLSLGEAGAWAIVEAANGSTGDAIEVAGWGDTSDAIHMTAPDREATGLTRAITKACAMAGCRPADVGAIAAHGTGTVFNDAMEMKAFARVFGSPRPTFSTKGGTGHTLAAAGLLQMAVLMRAMVHGVLPPTVGLESADADAAGWVSSRCAEISGVSVALSASSGFGGVNTAVVLVRGRG